MEPVKLLHEKSMEPIPICNAKFSILQVKKKLNKQVNNKQKANNVHSYQINCEFIPPFSQPTLMTTCHLFREKRKKKVSSSLTAYRMMIMDLGERF